MSNASGTRVARPRLLDLFCGAGGAAMGYHRAGFDVVGVDIKPQPNYPFEFVKWDAVSFMGCGLWESARLSAIHASPPCQGYSKLAAMHPERTYPRLIEPVRQMLRATGLPWVIENVEGSPMSHHPALDGTWGVVLCGTAFGLGVERGDLQRHRAFESSFPIAPTACRHQRPAVGVYGHGGHSGKHRMLYRKEAAEAMGIDWMSRDEMTQAIPPAYTKHIGQYLLEHLNQEAAA